MTSAMRRLHRRLPEEERYPPTPREIIDFGGWRRPPDEAARDLTIAAHFAYGAGMRRADRRRRPAAGHRAPAPRPGVAVWVGELSRLDPGARPARTGHRAPGPAQRADDRRSTSSGAPPPPWRCASSPTPAKRSSPKARTRTCPTDNPPLQGEASFNPPSGSPPADRSPGSSRPIAWSTLVPLPRRVAHRVRPGRSGAARMADRARRGHAAAVRGGGPFAFLAA